MDDATYLFNQTSYGAKRLARGAYAKKNGSKTKKCSLPSDHLTERQRKELNGKVETYNLSKPMSWNTFRKMPDDLKVKYLSSLVNDYDARCKDIADMFGVGANYLSLQVKDIGFSFPHTGRRTPDKKWLDFIAPEPPKPEPIPEPVEEPNVPDEPPARVKLDDPDTICKSGNILYYGKPADVFQRAFEVLDKNTIYGIHISFKIKEDADNEAVRL